MTRSIDSSSNRFGCAGTERYLLLFPLTRPLRCCSVPRLHTLRLRPHTATGTVGCGVATSASVLMLDSSNRLRHSEDKQSVSANIDVRAS